MKKIGIIVLLIAFLAGCGKKTEELPEPPENLMSEEEFVDFYIDIRLLEASLQQKFQSNLIAKEVAVNSVNHLLKEKGFTYEDFEANFEYYGLQPQKMYQLFDQILNELNRKKAEARKGEAEEDEENEESSISEKKEGQIE